MISLLNTKIKNRIIYCIDNSKTIMEILTIENMKTIESTTFFIKSKLESPLFMKSKSYDPNIFQNS